MKKVLRFCLILLFYSIFFISHIYAVENIAESIAKLSAKQLYELDKDALENILYPYISEKKDIQSLQIIDVETDEIYFSYNTDKKKKISKCSFNQEQYNAPITYFDREIGSVTLCLKKIEQQTKKTKNLDDQNLVKQIANLTAPALFELEKNRAEAIINSLVANNDQIRSISIIDLLSNDTFYSYEKQNNQLLKKLKAGVLKQRITMRQI